MRIPRIYYPGELSPQMTIQLDAVTTQYIRTVLRLKPKAPITLFNGETAEYRGIVMGFTKQSTTVAITDSQLCQTESPLAIHLGQVISRGQKMDYTIQKATELGVSEITPLYSERCNVKLDQTREQTRRHHWQQIAIHAAEQSGRTHVPHIHPPLPLAHWLMQAPQTADTDKLVMDPDAQQPFSQSQQISALYLLIGPEGGLTQDEGKLAQQHDFTPTRFGPRILRTETAAVVALAITQHRLGDL